MPSPERPGPERAGGAVGSPKAASLAMTAVLLASCALSGCASRTIARQRPPLPGPSGNTWELVFESPSAASTSYAASDRPEMTRRNNAMNIAVNTPTLATDRWPEDPRPNLRYDRRIYLPTNERTYLYFDSTYQRYNRSYRSRSSYRFGY